jgi:glucan phosphoethanolaminetransferase (alkaline phosphatase superfamily)
MVAAREGFAKSRHARCFHRPADVVDRDARANLAAIFFEPIPDPILSAAFAAYTITYDSPPGQFIAYVLATSSWAEVRGFFSIWQGMRLLLAAVIVGSLYLFLAIWSPPRSISCGRNVRVRYGFLAAVVVLSAFAAQSPAAFIDGIAINPPIATAMLITGPLRQAEAGVNGTAVRKVRYGASRSDGEEVHILIIGEGARRDSWSVYGYQRNTTPYLEKLRGEAIFLQNAVADANFNLCRAHTAHWNEPGSFRYE